MDADDCKIRIAQILYGFVGYEGTFYMPNGLVFHATIGDFCWDEGDLDEEDEEGFYDKYPIFLGIDVEKIKFITIPEELEITADVRGRRMVNGMSEGGLSSFDESNEPDKVIMDDVGGSEMTVWDKATNRCERVRYSKLFNMLYCKKEKIR